MIRYKGFEFDNVKEAVEFANALTDQPKEKQAPTVTRKYERVHKHYNKKELRFLDGVLKGKGNATITLKEVKAIAKDMGRTKNGILAMLWRLKRKTA